MLRVITDMIVGESAAGKSHQSRRDCQREQLVAEGADSRSFRRRLVLPNRSDPEPNSRRDQRRDHHNTNHGYRQSEIVARQNTIGRERRRRE